MKPRRKKTSYKDALWSKAQALFMLQKALKQVPTNSPNWVNLFKQYAQCRGFYSEPAQAQGLNVAQVIALRHFDSEEEFYTEAKKQQLLLQEKNKKVIEQMEAEREREATEDR